MTNSQCESIILMYNPNIKYKEEIEMAKKYCCKACDYVYNPQKGDLDGGVAPGVDFKDLPETWICPECGVGKEYFEPVGGEEE